VIAGFTEPGGARRHFGALVLGVFEGGDLVYIGQVGGGFGARSLREVRERLEPLIRKKNPFGAVPALNAPVTWVKPELVCEVAFRGWTDEGIMRQPVFLRLRDDKAAREVVRENPDSSPSATDPANGAGGQKI
jgi:bifunctional non-homologous end joining protein LigD